MANYVDHSATKFVFIFYCGTFFSSCSVINISKMCFLNALLWFCPPPLNVQWTLSWELVNMSTARKVEKITWRRMVEKEMQQMGKTWSSISVMAKDRQEWRDHVAALHATRRNGHE